MQTSSASAAVKHERFSVTADDGFRLAALRWVPPAPRAVLHIAHGMAEHASRYASFAETCAAAGIAVYSHDHRGHGDSVDEATPLGFFAASDGWAKVLGDVRTVHRRAREEHPGLPLFQLGHSMGSLVVRAFIVEHGGDLSGAIVSATAWRAGILNSGLRWVASREARQRGPTAPSARMSSLVFGTFNLRFRPARTAFDWLSRDQAIVDAYVADPRCGFDCSGQLWADLLAGVSELEKAEGDSSRLPSTLPLLLIVGTHDPVSMGGLGHTQLAKRYLAAGNNSIEDRRYPEARHEILNETNRAEVFRDVIRWIEARV